MINLLHMVDTMDDQENIKQILNPSTLCSHCGLVKADEYTKEDDILMDICLCVHHSVPIPTIKDDKLVFVMVNYTL
jgi:hypothetical protein